MYRIEAVNAQGRSAAWRSRSSTEPRVLRFPAHSTLKSEEPVFSYDGSYLQQPDATPLSTRFPLDDLPVSDVSLRYWLMGMLPDDERVLRRLAICRPDVLQYVR